MRRKYFILIFLSICMGLPLHAQLKLIPMPKKVIIKSNSFTIEQNTKILSNGLDLFYANELSTCMREKVGIQLGLANNATSNYIEFIKAITPEALKAITKANGLDPDFKTGKEGYILLISPQGIKIFSTSDAGIFYGIQTLKQIIAANRIGYNLPCLVIYDAPDIPVRGWQDDISRGPIPTMATLKEEIVKMSSFKLNYFTLYIEQVFKLDKHPGIAPSEGITKAEINELSEFARQYHVNLIGSYQSFGHMEKTLSNPKYQHLAENGHIISPAREESYQFLGDVYSEIVPSFSGEYFNINCDETYGLGEGASKRMVDSLGLGGVYLYHINRLDKIIKPYGKKILMWGDIIGNHPEIIKQLPKDITVIAWGYHAADNFEYAITPLAKSGLNFWVAPGVSCWSNIYPDFKTTEINVYNFIRDAYKHGVTGVLNTSWDDDGLNFFQNNWHGFSWGAENSWNAPVSFNSNKKSDGERKRIYDSFNKSFDAIFYGLQNDSLTQNIATFSALRQSDVRDILTNSRFFEPLFPILLGDVAKGKKEENINLLNKLDALSNKIDSVLPKVKDNRSTLDYLSFAMKQVRFTLLKNLLRIDLYLFIHNEEAPSATELKNHIETLTRSAQQFKSDYAALWHQENRDYWLDKNLKKFDELISDISNLETHCIITPSPILSEKGREISIKSLFNDLPVYYSIDTTHSDESFMKYTGPLYFKRDVDLRAIVIQNDKAYPMSESKLVYHKAIGALYQLNSTYSNYHPSYDGGGKLGLLDGLQGDASNLRSGKWQGYGGQNIDIEIDLDKVQPLNYFSMGFYQNTFDWVIFPRKIDIFAKTGLSDKYKLVKTINNVIGPEEKGSIKHNYTTEFNNLQARFIKVVAYYYGKLPEWHHAGSKYESMIFADEIILK